MLENYYQYVKRFCCISKGTAFPVSCVLYELGSETLYDRLQRTSLRKRHHPDLCTLVSGLPVELLPSGRDDERARCTGRSFHSLPLGLEIHSPAGGHFLQWEEAAGGQELAHG